LTPNRGGGADSWSRIAIFAADFWKRIDDPKDKLYQFRDKIYEIEGKIRNEELDDEYAKAVTEGKIKEEKKEGISNWVRRHFSTKETAGKNDEAAEEKKEEEFSAASIEREFEKTFNFKEEDLETIPDFRELSEGQQSLVLKNFQELTLKAIEEKAIEKVRDEAAQTGFMGRVWHGVFRKYYSAKAEKLSAKEILSGGIEMHRGALADLVSQTIVSGLDAEFDEEGKRLKILFAGQLENLNPEQEKLVARFNDAADKFVSTSSDWRYSKKEKSELEKIRSRYNLSLDDLAGVMLEAKGQDFEVEKYIADVDKRVRLSQFLSSNPDASEELQKIQSQSVWKKALWNTATERGGYMAMGFAARTATVSILGLVGAPLAAAGMGGWIARNRAVESLREEAKLAESGKKHSELITAVKAGDLERKIGELLGKLESIKEDDKDRYDKTLEIADQLNTRLTYTRFKMENGLVQYGEGAEKKLWGQYTLLEKMSEAEVQVRNCALYKTRFPSDEQAQVQARLERYMGFKERKVKENVRGQIIKGALLGAGFAALGYGIRAFFETTPSAGTAGAPHRAGEAGSTEHLFKEITKDMEPSKSLDILTKMGVSADSLRGGVSPDSIKDLLKVGVTTQSLVKFGIPPDTLIKAGVPKDTLNALIAETAKMEKVSPDSILHVLKEKFPVFAKDSTFHSDSSGVITRQGFPGTYSIDKTTGDLVYSGGTGVGGNEIAAQVLKGGSGAEKWVEAPPGVGVKPEQLELASIKKGEGVWHAVHRQLEEQCRKDPSKFNLKPEDIKDAAKLKSVLNKETARILSENKFLKPDGSEVRIRDIGTRVILRDGNKVEIAGGKTYDWHPPKVKEEFSAPLKGLRDTQWIDEQRTFLLGKPSLLEKAGVNRWLVSDAADTYKGTVGELTDLGHIRGLSALEQENLLAAGRHGAAQLDQWGLKPGTGGSFASHFESVLRKSNISELTHRNVEIYNDIAKRVSSASGIEWAKAGRMRVSDMMRWHKEPGLDMKPGTFRLVETVSKLNPSRHEQALTLDEFLKNNIRSGKTDFLKVLESTPKAPVDIIGAHHEELNSLVHGLARENLNELRVQIPRYATVLNAKPEDIEHAFTELGKTKDIVGDLPKLVAEHPDQARLLSKVLEAEPELKPEVQAFKHALDSMIGKAPADTVGVNHPGGAGSQAINEARSPKGKLLTIEHAISGKGQIAPGEIKIESGNMNGVAKFVYDSGHNPLRIDTDISMRGSTGSELFKDNWRESILSKSAEGKSSTTLLEGKTTVNGRLLSQYLEVYDKISGNPAYQKESSFLVKAIKSTIESITKDVGDVVDKGKLPEIFRSEK